MGPEDDHCLSNEDLEHCQLDLGDTTPESQFNQVHDAIRRLQVHCTKLALRHCRACRIHDEHVQNDIIRDLVGDAYGLAKSGIGAIEFHENTRKLAQRYAKQAWRRRPVGDVDRAADPEKPEQTAEARDLYRFLERLLKRCLVRFAETNPHSHPIVHAIIYLPKHDFEAYSKSRQKRALDRFREKLLAMCAGEAAGEAPDRRLYTKIGEFLRSTKKKGSTQFRSMLRRLHP